MMNREASAVNYEMGSLATFSIMFGSIYANFFSSRPLHVGFWKLFLVWILVSWLIGAAISAVCTASAVSLSYRISGSTRGANWPFMVAFAMAAVAGWFVGLYATKFLA